MQEDVYDATGNPQLKPLAAPYERALRLLGRAPSRVAALEDSVVGVRAAAAAGVGVVLGVLNGEDDGVEAAAALREAGAAGVFPSTVAALDWCTANAVPQPPAQPADMVRSCPCPRALFAPASLGRALPPLAFRDRGPLTISLLTIRRRRARPRRRWCGDTSTG